LLGAAVIYIMLPPVNIPVAVFRGGVEANETTLLQRIRLPEGFRFTVFATGLPGARIMSITPADDLLVSTPRSGEVHLLYRDDDGDGAADGRKTLLAGLTAPHGIDLHDGWLYVAETDAIGRVRFDAAGRRLTGEYERIVTGLPGSGNHRAKTLRFGPDGWMYVTVGSSCNVCVEQDARRAAMLRISPDGGRMEIHAWGLRNSVGFDWSPRDGSLYATDNGRDLLGDDFPPDELNRIVADGFYGWPWINGFGEPDPDEHRTEPGSPAIEPVHGFRPHNAPLGISFLRARSYPDDYHHDALVALHGSWNRSEKDGYKVVRLHWSEQGQITETDFMTGFLADDDVIGRPVDVVESTAGMIFVSDDFSGAVYRIQYQDH